MKALASLLLILLSFVPLPQSRETAILPFQGNVRWYMTSAELWAGGERWEASLGDRFRIPPHEVRDCYQSNVVICGFPCDVSFSFVDDRLFNIICDYSDYAADVSALSETLCALYGESRDDGADRFNALLFVSAPAHGKVASARQWTTGDTDIFLILDADIPALAFFPCDLLERQADSFPFRDGVQWYMTSEEVWACGEVYVSSYAPNYENHPAETRLYFKDSVPANGCLSELIYYFMDDQLVCLLYDFTESVEDASMNISDLRDALTARYGECREDTADRFNALLSIPAPAHAQIECALEWTIGDSLIFLVADEQIPALALFPRDLIK